MTCKNCQAELSENTRYCLECGARVIRNRLNFKNLMHQLGEEFFNYDNKILKTLKHLITRPEDVIDGYVKGTRKKYMNPISLMTISLAISGIQMYLIKNFFPDFFVNPVVTDMNVDEKNRVAAEAIQDFSLKMADAVEITTFITIPLLALISYIIFWNLKKYNYIEHLIIYLYTYPVTSIFSSILTIIAALFDSSAAIAVVGFVILPVMLIYNIYVLKRTMGIDWPRMLLKTFLFFVLAFGLYIMFIIIFGIIFFVYLKLGGEIPEIMKPFYELGRSAAENQNK